MKKKYFVNIILILVTFSPFLGLLLTSVNENRLNIPSYSGSRNPSPDLGVETWREISNSSANGTRSSLNVTQYVKGNKTMLDWLNQNDPGLADNTPVGNISRDFNVSGIDNYNKSKIKIQIHNVSAEPTWEDVEYDVDSGSGNDRIYINNFNCTAMDTAMEFNVTVRSRLTKIAWYGSVVNINTNTWYWQIWNRTSQWSGDPDTYLTSSSSNGGDPDGWSEISYNLNLTPGSYFFVINGSQLQGAFDGGYWYYKFGSDADSYAHTDAGWSPISPAKDYGLKVQLVPIDVTNNTLKNIDPTSIGMNMTIGAQEISVFSNGTHEFTNLNKQENETVTLTANASFSANITWEIWCFNKTNTTIVMYNGSQASAPTIHWNFNFTVNHPIPNYGETLSEYNITIFKPSPSWDLDRALNATNQNVTTGIVEDSQTIFLSNNTDPILTNGLWKFRCFNFMMYTLFNFNQTAVASRYPGSAYVHGETIQINASAPGFSNGYINLTIFNSTGHNVVTDWTTTKDLPLGDYVLFNITVPANALPNNYTIDVMWSNDTHVGINGTDITIVNDTSLTVITESQVSGEQLIGNDINLTVYFNDTHSNAPITGANVTFQLYNETDHSIVTQAFLDESATAGYYNYTISTSDYVNGSYQLLINASKDWYNNQSITRNFTLVYDTQIANITPGVTNIIGFFPDNLTISVNYSTHNPGEIENAIVNFTTNQTTVEGVLNGSLIWDPSSKTYNVTLNSTDFDVNYVYEINVSAWKEGYLAQLVTFYWNLTIGQTELIVYLNNTGFEYEQFIELSAYYNDTIHNSGIAGASVNVTCSWNNTMLTMNPSTPDGNYTIIFDTSLIGVEQGPLGFLVNAVKPKYEYQENNTYNSVPLNKQSTTKVNLNGSALNNAIYDVYWGETFFVNVSYHRSDDSLITGTATAIGNWTIPGTQYRSLTNGFYIFEVPLNGSNLNPPITHAGLWGLNFTVNSTNYATAFEDFTVNITTLTHLNASDSAGKSYNNTLTYEGEFANITIYYNDTIFDQQLVTYTIMSNWSVISNYLTDFTGSGYCNISLNTTGIAPGDYSVTINASALNYQFQEIIVNITIKEKYNVTIINFDDTIEGSYVPGDSVDIIIRILNGSNPIVGFVVNITINASTPINLQFSTNASGYITYQYSVRSEDVGSALNITIIFPEAFEYNSNSTSYIITIEQAKREQLFPPLLGGKGLDPIILFIVIGAVAVGIIAVVAVVGAKKRKEKIELEKKKTISSVTDVANIRHILVIHKGTGIDIFNYAVEKGLDPTLISGFIQAVKGFGKELSRKATGEECKE
ncbi:MAG: hypothetical protein ACTSR3_18225 [Candidatus Helarchaeota archaeon]